MKIEMTDVELRQIIEKNNERAKEILIKGLELIENPAELVRNLPLTQFTEVKISGKTVIGWDAYSLVREKLVEDLDQFQKIIKELNEEVSLISKR